MKAGVVQQRQTASCPRDPDDGYRAHKRHGNSTHQVVVGSRTKGNRRPVTKARYTTRQDTEIAARNLRSRDDYSISAPDGHAHWLEDKLTIRAITRRSYESPTSIYLTP